MRFDRQQLQGSCPDIRCFSRFGGVNDALAEGTLLQRCNRLWLTHNSRHLMRRNGASREQRFNQGLSHTAQTDHTD